MQDIDLKDVYVYNKKKTALYKAAQCFYTKKRTFFTYTTDCIPNNYINQTRYHTLSVVHDFLPIINSSQPDTMPSILHIITGREFYAHHS